MKNKLFKNITKAIGVGVALVAIGFNSFAATLTQIYNLAATNNLVATNGMAIYKITIANAGTNALTIKFFDAPYTNLTYSSATGYTNFTVTSMTFTNIYTNYNGVIETNTFANSVTNTANVSPGFTNSFTALLTMVVPTNTTTVFTPERYLYALQGLTTTNTTCGASSTVTIDYSPFK